MAASKKRSDSNRPKRPLSAYNLFYRYKRAKIIEANNGSGCNRCDSREAVFQLIFTPPGLESYPQGVQCMIPSDKVAEIRRANIRLALDQQLFAKDTKKRLHRKSTHGYKMTFVEMNKIMVETWKMVDQYGKSMFQELADGGRKEYQERLNEYNKNKEQQFSIGVKQTATSSPGGESTVKKPRLVYTYAPPEELSSPPSKATAMAMAPNVESNFGSMWEPLPLENQNLAGATPNGPCLSHRFQPERQVSDLSQTVPHFLSSVASRGLVTPTSRSSNVSSIPSPSFFLSVLSPPPFGFDMNGFDVGETVPQPMSLEESTSSLDSSFNGLGTKDGVSVDDFLQLIATLD